jgi:hypothetical protein
MRTPAILAVLLFAIASPGCIFVAKTETVSPDPARTEAGLREELRRANERIEELEREIDMYRDRFGTLSSATGPDDEAGSSAAGDSTPLGH